MRIVEKRSALLWALYGAAAFYAFFQLPFDFPPTERLVSPSYCFGFNNHVAVFSCIVLIGLGTLYRIREENSAVRLCFSSSGLSKVSRRLLATALAVYLILTFAIYCWARLHDSYGVDWEMSHFFWRLKLSEVYGLRPYRDYQYEYGPLLAYLPIWSQKLCALVNLSNNLTYYLLYWALDAAGLCGIAFILDHLEMPKRRKNVTFGALAAALFLPYMGLSGVLLRFIAPLFGLVVIHHVANRRGRLLVLWTFVGTLIMAALNIGLSSEIGISFLIAAGVYGLLLLPRGVGIAVIFAVAVTILLSPILLPHAYYTSLFHFSQGANNLPLLPTSPHLILYLIALLWFVPQWLAEAWRNRTNSAPIFAVSCLSVILIPGALGRCDPPHVLTYGLTLTLLVFAHMANCGKVPFLTTVLAYVAVFAIGFQAINVWVFHLTPASVVASLRHPRVASQKFVSLSKYETLALPFGTYGSSKALQNWLWRHRKVAPEYYLGGMGLYTEAQVADRLHDLGRFQYAITDSSMRPLSNGRDSCAFYQPYIRKALLHWQPLACKNQAIDPDVEIAQFLERHYRVIERDGEYLVWRRLD